MKDKKQNESLKYLSAIGGILAASGVSGQIKYVDIADTTLNTNNAYWDLDMDEDSLGVVDYRFIQYVDTSIFNVSGSFLQARGVAGNSILGLDYGNYAYPFNLSPGDSIGPGKAFKGSGGSFSVGQLALEISGSGHSNDKFNGAVNGLIGVRFRTEIEDTMRTFFGWIRVDLAADYKSITIKDYAYQEQYDQGITAGEGAPWIGLPDFEEKRFMLRQVDLQLYLENPSAEATLHLYSMGGALVKTEVLEKGNHYIGLQDLQPGIYIARLDDGEFSEEIKVLVY